MFLSSLIIFFFSRPDFRSLRQGSRSGLDYAEWITRHGISVAILRQALGAPLQTTTLSTERKIYWFQIKDGLLGIEDSGQIIHFKTDSAKFMKGSITAYGPPSASYVVASEVITNYSDQKHLGLTVVEPISQHKGVKEVILWRIE